MATPDMSTISFKDIERMAKEIRQAPVPMFGMGMPVYELPEPPQKIKLSDSAPVTDEFRRKFDGWLRDRFGVRDSLLRRDEVYVTQFGMIARPEAIYAIKHTT